MDASDDVEVRRLRDEERPGWLLLRKLLWPDLPQDLLMKEQLEILAAPGRNAVWVAAPREGSPVGFVEAALRDTAEGCLTSPVGYIEAWYVKPDYRRSGVGRKLIEAAEQWARAQGCTEMGSDTEIDNDLSAEAHQALGYVPVSRLVLFAKRLEP